MRFISSKDPDGPIRIKDATIYRLRPNNGRFNHKFTRPQMEKMLREAPKPIPIRDTHNYFIDPIGGVKRCWVAPNHFGQRDWLHFEADIGDKKTLGAFRHNNLKERFRKGLLNECSISVAMSYLDKKKGIFDPDSARIVEFSVCKKGEHKNTTIQVLEAADINQVKRQIQSGSIEQLEIPVQKMSGAVLAKPNPGPQAPLSIAEIVEEANTVGVSFTEEELAQLSTMDVSAVAAMTLRKAADLKRMADTQLTDNEKELAELRELKKKVNEDYAKKREPEVKAAVEFYDAKLAATEGMTQEKRDAVKALIAQLGMDKVNSPVFDLLAIGNNTAAAEKKEKEDKQKELEAANTQMRALERKVRQYEGAPQKPAEKKVAAPPPAEREEAPAKRQRVEPAAAPAKNAPENLGQKLAGQKYATGEVLIESSAEHGDQKWIDHWFPLSYQGTFAKSVEAKSLESIYDIMNEVDFKERALTTEIPPIGKQGFNQQRTPFAWGSKW